MTESRLRTIATIATLIGVVVLIVYTVLIPRIRFTDDSKQLKEALEDSLKVRNHIEDSLRLEIVMLDSASKTRVFQVDSLKKVTAILSVTYAQLVVEFRGIKKKVKVAGDEQRVQAPDKQLEDFIDNAVKR